MLANIIKVVLAFAPCGIPILIAYYTFRHILKYTKKK